MKTRPLSFSRSARRALEQPESFFAPSGYESRCPVTDAEWPRIYSGYATYTTTYATSWDGNEIKCSPSSIWTATLEENGDVMLLGEDVEVASLSGTLQCLENDIIIRGTHSGGNTEFDLFYDEKGDFKGKYNDDFLTGNYSFSETGMHFGFGEVSRSEALDLNLPFKP